MSVVVDGKTLMFALEHSLRKEFIELLSSCSSVICCRVSPLQKAEVVENTYFNQIGYYITELFQCSGCCCGTAQERGVSNMKKSHMEMKFHDEEL